MTVSSWLLSAGDFVVFNVAGIPEVGSSKLNPTLSSSEKSKFQDFISVVNNST